MAPRLAEPFELFEVPGDNLKTTSRYFCRGVTRRYVVKMMSMDEVPQNEGSFRQESWKGRNHEL
jgi:hypothetical protein